jgi:LacI family transcriptional regulator
MTTIRQVAERAGVSVATVSRVLNGNGYVGKETERRIRQAMEELNFEPNALARGLAGKKMHIISLVLPDITNPFFPELARAVEDVCRQHRFTLFLCNSDDQWQREKEYIEALKRRNTAGIIFATQSLVSADIQNLIDAQIPVIVLDRVIDRSACSVIRVNNMKGAEIGVRHLLEVGCRKIAHVYGPPEISTAKERMIGYEESVKAFPWYSPSLMVPGYFTFEGGIQAVDVLLARHPDVDGIFCGNDMMAIGVLKALQRRGIRVPEQIAVCGFDGIKMSEIVEPELTTVAQPIYRMGSLAANALIRQIKGEPLRSQVYEMEVTLLARQSTRRSGAV